MSINKLSNEYQRVLGRFFDECPKAVLAAIAVSYASNGGDDLNGAVRALAHEWQVLYANGIVPQQPPSWIKAEALKHPLSLAELEIQN